MKQYTLITISMTICVFVSCLSRPVLQEYSDISDQVKYFAVLNFPSEKFDEIVWRGDGKLIAMQSESTAPLQPYAFEGDTTVKYLDLVQESNCIFTHYRFPTQLPDGRLGWIKWCATDNVFADKSYMVAYDWNSGQLEQIILNPLKHFDIAQCFSWDPDMKYGVQSVSNGLVGTLNWLTSLGPEPFRVVLQDDHRVWDLAKDFDIDGSREGGTLSCPAWSPQGDEIAVFVSFDAMRVEGISRLDKQMKLMLISPETGTSESVLSGVYYPKALQWSPNAKQIVFIGYVENGLMDYQGNEPNGVWIFDVETKSLSLIARDGYFRDLSWSPDAKEIAVIWCDDVKCGNSEIRKYTLLER